MDRDERPDRWSRSMCVRWPSSCSTVCFVVAAPAADTVVHVSRCCSSAVACIAGLVEDWRLVSLIESSVERSGLPAEAAVVCMHVHSTLLQHVSGKPADIWIGICQCLVSFGWDCVEYVYKLITRPGLELLLVVSDRT